MIWLRNMFVTLALCSGFLVAARAQVDGKMASPPEMPGRFSPLVGSGAQYEVATTTGPDLHWAYAVVGEDDPNGKKGCWLEVRLLDGTRPEMIMKEFVVTGRGKLEIKRTIVQVDGRPPFELQKLKWRQVEMVQEELEIREQWPTDPSTYVPKRPKAGGHPTIGKKVGTETITVTGGTFECEHYRGKTETGEVADSWISSKITPFGLVKMTSKDETIILQKVLENEISQIKYEPKKVS